MKRFVFIQVVSLLALIFLSCGKSREDVQKTIVYLDKARAFVSSQDYFDIYLLARDSSVKKDTSGVYYLDEKKYQTIYNNELGIVFDSIARGCGFRNFKQADSYVSDLKENSEVKPVLDLYVRLLKDRHDEIQRDVDAYLNRTETSEEKK